MMDKHPQLSLAMSQIIAADAPLLSPVSDSNWDQPLFSPSHDTFFPYYTMGQDSPTASPAPMLKMRMSPDEDPELCLPTHQLFDFPQQQAPPTPSIRDSRRQSADDDDALSSSGMSSCGNKRSASPAPSASKKRAIGERICSKDFIPPDVSGLSKREARLVKNRAAAFLSRQRKREEFECMEVRVQELEQENARLLALTQSTPGTIPQPAAQSEVEQLRAQLALANERALTLSAKLASSDVSVKLEPTSDTPFSLSSPHRPSQAVLSPTHKSGASLGLMVLLCALPTLLSMRMQSTAPTSFSIPNPFPSSNSFDYNSNAYLSQSDYDWTKAGPLMDLDDSHHNALSSSSSVRKLEFSDTDAPGLGDLDISFDTVAADDGKIRVRIHPSSGSSPTSRAQSPGASSTTSDSSSSSSSASSQSSLAMWSGAPSTQFMAGPPPTSSSSSISSSPSSLSSSSSLASLHSKFTSTFGSLPPAHNNAFSHYAPDGSVRYGYDGSMKDGSGPFYHTSPAVMSASDDDDARMFGLGGLGMGMYDMDMPTSDFGMGLSSSGIGSAMETHVLPTGSKGERRRVRIALKSMPEAGGAEGGEWEVQIC